MKKLKYLLIITEFIMVLILVSIMGACFFALGRATRTEAIHPEVERAARETFAGREGK